MNTSEMISSCNQVPRHTNKSGSLRLGDFKELFATIPATEVLRVPIRSGPSRDQASLVVFQAKPILQTPSASSRVSSKAIQAL